MITVMNDPEHYIPSFREQLFFNFLGQRAKFMSTILIKSTVFSKI